MGIIFTIDIVDQSLFSCATFIVAHVLLLPFPPSPNICMSSNPVNCIHSLYWYLLHTGRTEHMGATALWTTAGNACLLTHKHIHVRTVYTAFMTRVAVEMLESSSSSSLLLSGSSLFTVSTLISCFPRVTSFRPGQEKKAQHR